MDLETALVSCPYCWEMVELSLDLSAGSQAYTEDCPVCCQPMLVRLRVDPEGGGHEVDVEAENG
jgi:cysteine-rich CPXCG protein